MDLYEKYLLMIRDNLIRCGVGLPVKDSYTYEELFNLAEEIDQILWYYRVLAIANSRDKLKDFIFPMDRTYVSYMRNVFYQEYCESKKDRREVTVEGLRPNTDTGYEYKDTDEVDEEEIIEKSFEEGNGVEQSRVVDTKSTSNDLTEADLDEIWGTWGDDQDEEGSDETTSESIVNNEKNNQESSNSDLKELQSDKIYVTMDMLETDENGFYVYNEESDEDAVEEDPFDSDDTDTLWEDEEDESVTKLDNMDEISTTDDSEDDFPDRGSEDEDDEDNSDDEIFSSWGDDESEDTNEDVDNVEDVDEEDEEGVDFPDDEQDDEEDSPDNGVDEDEEDFPDMDDSDDEEDVDEMLSDWGNDDDMSDEDDVDFPDEDGNDTDVDEDDVDFPDNDEEDEEDFPDMEDEEDSDDTEDFPDWDEDVDNTDSKDEDFNFSDWDEDQDEEQEKAVKSVNINKGSTKRDRPTSSDIRKEGVGSKKGMSEELEHTRDEQFIENFDKVINGTLNFGRKSGKKIINKIWKGMTNQE